MCPMKVQSTEQRGRSHTVAQDKQRRRTPMIGRESFWGWNRDKCEKIKKIKINEILGKKIKIKK